MTIMESINVKVDGYLRLTSYSRLKDLPTSSPSKEVNILSIPKDGSISDCGDSCLVLAEVRTTPVIIHPIKENVRTLIGTNPHMNKQDNDGQTDSQAREPSRKIRKNHLAFDIIGEPEGSV